MSVLFAVIISGGCGGSSSSGKINGNGSSSGDDSEYINNVTKKLLEESTVTNLADFLNDKTKTVKKGDILLYILNDDDNVYNISENTEYLTRINDALETGAIVAFSNITAEELDNIVDELGLDVPPYLPDNATEKEKSAVEDFFAVAARSDGVDSENIVIVNFYTFYGTELEKPASMDIHVYSGDQEITDFNPSEYTHSTAESMQYYIASEDKIISNDPNPFSYDYVEDTVQNFFDWCDELGDMKSVKEVESSVSTSTVSIAASEASVTFPGVTASFNFVQNYAPRDYYYTITLVNGKRSFTHPNPWHRETSMAFNIVPVWGVSLLCGVSYAALRMDTMPTQKGVKTLDDLYVKCTEVQDEFSALMQSLSQELGAKLVMRPGLKSR